MASSARLGILKQVTTGRNKKLQVDRFLPSHFVLFFGLRKFVVSDTNMRSLLFVSSAILMAVLASADTCQVNLKANKWDAPQQYDGQTPMFSWWMNPTCTEETPAGDTGLPACTTDGSAGFVGQWNPNGGSCIFMMKEHIQWWTKNGDTVTASFALLDGSKTATINLDCTGTSPGLHHNGNVVVEETQKAPQQKFKYTFKMVTDAAGCENAVNTPAPTPKPATTTSDSTSTIESVSASGTPNPEGHNNQTTPNPGTTVTVPSAGTESGCGGGCVFLLILGVLIPVYAVGAILWNFRVGKRGKELAPHPEIWGEVIALIKEGCIFFAQTICGCVDKCRGKGGE